MSQAVPTSAAVVPKPATFTPYQVFVVALLAFLQFTIVLDFMILSPLGAILLRELGLSTGRFGFVVSAYAFSAGLSGLLAAGFADRFDRKSLLLFFYSGFVLGTFLCSLASSYHFLLFARIVTGVFGGVVGSISFAIITDLFPFEVRGRVMGTVQTAFATSQVLGLPLGLWLAAHWGWHAPFRLIVAVSLAVGVVIVLRLRPIDAHLKTVRERDPVAHLIHTATRPRYLIGFSATMLLATGGFMLMPFGSAFTVHNLGIPLTKLPLVYMITGAVSIVAGPLIGRLSDAWGKYTTFCVGTVAALLTVVTYTHLGPSPLWKVIAINSVLFVFIMSRMISASALTSGVPAPADRGAYMSISSSLQQLSGGVAASIAGMIVVQSPDGRIGRYDVLGWVAAAAMSATVLLMFNVHRLVREKPRQA